MRVLLDALRGANNQRATCTYCMLFCCYQDADGVTSLEDVLDGYQQNCVGSCASMSQATTELLSCAVANGDCLDVCFPPVE